MQEPPFRGRRPVMIGDDLPDEAALATAVTLGGTALKVAGEHFRGGESDFAGPSRCAVGLKTWRWCSSVTSLELRRRRA